MRFNIPCLAVALTAAIPALAQSPLPPSPAEQNVVSDLQMLSTGDRRLQSDLFEWKKDMEAKATGAEKRATEWAEYIQPLLPCIYEHRCGASTGPPVK